MKYAWTNSINEPTEFTQTCTDNSAITAKDFTGEYYLWVMVKTEAGTYKYVSEAFKFDNEGPNITDFTADKYSIDGITFNSIVLDEESGLDRIEFYIDDEIQNDYTKIYEVATASVSLSENITGIKTGNHKCKIVAFDKLENRNELTVDGMTKMYTWNIYKGNVALQKTRMGR